MPEPLFGTAEPDAPLAWQLTESSREPIAPTDPSLLLRRAEPVIPAEAMRACRSSNRADSIAFGCSSFGCGSFGCSSRSFWMFGGLTVDSVPSFRRIQFLLPQGSRLAVSSCSIPSYESRHAESSRVLRERFGRPVPVESGSESSSEISRESSPRIPSPRFPNPDVPCCRSNAAQRSIPSQRVSAWSESTLRDRALSLVGLSLRAWRSLGAFTGLGFLWSGSGAVLGTIESFASQNRVHGLKRVLA